MFGPPFCSYLLRNVSGQAPLMEHESTGKIKGIITAYLLEYQAHRRWAAGENVLYSLVHSSRNRCNSNVVEKGDEILDPYGD
jgi:hypothetical protein